MKTLFAMAAIAALIFGSSAAYTADDHPDEQHGKAQGQSGAQGQSRPPAQSRPQAKPQAQARPQAQVSPRTQSKPQAQAGQGQARPQSQPRNQAESNSQTQPRPQAQTVPQNSRNRASRASGAVPSNNAMRAPAAHAQAGGQAPAAARANVDIHTYQRNVSAQHQFHAGAYRAPQGYAYRRWSYGQSLPAIYFGRDFWLTDYDTYGLIAPPHGYVWVRFGPDALLIDEYSGEIVQVDYGMFY